VFSKLGLQVWPPWFTGDPCVGAATDGTSIYAANMNPGIKCDCSDQNNTICHIIEL